MFGFKTRRERVFWQWVADHHLKIVEELRRARDAQDFEWSVDRLGDQLSKYHPNLVHEIGLIDDSIIDLIISADGIREHFPDVIQLVNAAPISEHLKVTPLRPRVKDGFDLSITGNDITNEMLSYKIIDDNDQLGIEFFVNMELDRKTLLSVGYLSLDQRLGEYDVATGFAWIGFATGRPVDALPITQLAADFDARRGDTRR